MCLAKNKLEARYEHGENMSPQKNNKLKPILIALQRIAWSIKQILFKVWFNFKDYDNQLSP